MQEYNLSEKRPKDDCKRCRQCKKKTIVLSQCKCGGYFCISHRLAEDHGCDFDHKQFGRSVIHQNNPVIVSEKIKKL